MVRLRSIGDVVLTIPALAALHAWRPDLRIRVLVEPLYVPLLEGNPAVAEVMILQKFWPTVRELRERHFSIAFNMHGGPTSAWLTRLSGAPVRVCWTNRQFSFFYNVQVPPPAPINGRVDIHTAEHRLTQFLWTGLPVGPIPPATVYPQPDAVAAVQQRLAEKGIAPGEGYVVLRPGARNSTKRWSVEGFAQLARWLRESHSLMPVVNLGPGDEEIAAAVQQHLAPVSVVLDSLDLRQLIALIAGARLFVGNDTGPTHIAAALGKPCVVVFGSSHAAIWRPWKTEHRVVQNVFPCDYCPQGPQGRCATFDESLCILSVTVDQVRQACEALLTSEEQNPAEARSAR